MKTRQEKILSRRKSIKATSPLSFSARNYQIFGIGILVIILGYVALSKGPVNSFWSLTVAPILLVISYCVIIPISIFWKPKKTKDANQS
jgi:uncharacterized membrane protein HdeD (DUF308 family)